MLVRQSVARRRYPTRLLGGSYDYLPRAFDDGRGVLMSSDGGVTFRDVTGQDPQHASDPPDQHALVVHPNNPFLFFEGSDGGMVRTTAIRDVRTSATSAA